ncbi:MAG: hypothetical protein HY049_04385 [Acidobacteria bacterium]|nr:hypothetical protein [Acidobacteriota bacterium]
MALIPPNSVALAGEFAVLSQLVLRGYDASLTMGHTKEIDILVFHPATRTRYEVEVKTNLERRNRPTESRLYGQIVTAWQMNEKHERIQTPSLFYCFVHINWKRGDPSPDAFRFFMVPSKVVAQYVRDEHQYWLDADSAHKLQPRRLFRIGLPNQRKLGLPSPSAEKYENNWQFKV